MHGTVTGKIFEAHLIEVRLVPRRGSRPGPLSIDADVHNRLAVVGDR